MIRVDNGSEMTSLAFTQWCEAHDIKICYIEPGKPNQNAYIGKRPVKPSFQVANKI